MRLSQLVVEVRDGDLVRVGTIVDRYLRFDATLVANGVSKWSLRLPGDHELVPVLATAGAGIVVTGPGGVLLSGPTTAPVREASAEEPTGLLTVTGESDDVLAADALAWPQPGNPVVATQGEGHDVRSGPAGQVMAAYVNANIGPTAPMVRRGALARRLIVAPVTWPGPPVVRSARFDNLAELLTDIATVAGMGWQIVQHADNLRFETWATRDLTAYVRLSVHAGGLASQTVATTAPAVTHVVVAGQGHLAARTLLERTSPESLAAAVDWGRRIERFKDQRQTDNLTELEQAGDKDLAEEGFTRTDVVAVASDQTPGMRFGTDWTVGDTVTVVVAGIEATAVVTQAKIVVDSDGVRIGIGLGDPAGFDPAAATARQAENTARRVAALERHV